MDESSPQLPSIRSVLIKSGCVVVLLTPLILLCVAAIILLPSIPFLYLMAFGHRDTILHSAASPNQTMEAYLISDGCGATCDCTVRLDIQTESAYHRSVWRGIDICDASITWVDNSKLLLSESPAEVYVVDLTKRLSQEYLRDRRTRCISRPSWSKE
jgi:hypothetical protein